MAKRSLIALTTIAALLLGACPEEGIPSSSTDAASVLDSVSSPADATGSTDASGTDATAQPDVPGPPDVPPADTTGPDVASDVAPDVVVAPDATVAPAAIALWLVGADGAKGKGDDGSIRLFPSDDGYPLESHPGIQVDVVAAISGAAQGAEVTLSVAGTEVATTQLEVGPAGMGTAIFGAVDMPSTPELPGGFDVQVAVRGLDDAVVTRSRSVQLFVTACEVTVQAVDAGCSSADADAETPGTQVAVEIALVSGPCESWVLEAGDGGAPLIREGMFVDGTATLSLTPPGSAGQLAVAVRAAHPESTSLDGQATAEIDYDFVAPEVSFTAPDLGAMALTMADDEVLETAGLQITIAGLAEGADTVELVVAGAPLGTATPAADGSFSFPGVTIAADGPVSIQAMAADACGNVATADRTVTVWSSQATVGLVSPVAGAVLLARDDLVRATATRYEAVFEVGVEHGQAGAPVTVSCRADADGVASVDVGTSLVPASSAPELFDGTVQVEVDVDVELFGSQVVCMARYDGANPAASDEGSFTVALPAPSLTLIAPTADQRQNSMMTRVAGTAAGLNGQMLTLEVRSVGGAVAATHTIGPVSGGAFDAQIGISGGQGTWTLCLDGADAWGNVVSDTSPVACRAVVIDTTAPQLALVAPSTTLLEPLVDAAHADLDVETPGYQTSFAFKVTQETVRDDVEVCMALGGGEPSCQPVSDAFEAHFERVTLQPGTNPLSATARDAFGNASAELALPIHVDLPQPVVSFSDLAETLTTAISLPIVTVTVSHPSSGVALPGGHVVLRIDGVASQLAGVDLGDGSYRFSDVPLHPGANTFQATAGFAGQAPGATAPVVVTRKTAMPSIVVSAPSDGAVFNLSSSACVAAGVDCVMAVVVSTTSAEPGSAAELDVSCGDSDASYTADVGADGQAVFEGVVANHLANHLDGGGVCTLRPAVTDLAAQRYEGGMVTITVDRVAPVTSAYVMPELSQLLSIDDKSEAPGMQHPVVATVSGLEAGAVLSLSLMSGGEFIGEPIDHVLGSAVADGAGADVDFGLVDLPDGSVVIRVDARDAAGNPAAPLLMPLEVLSAPASVRFLTPQHPGDACGACRAGALCLEDACWHKWGQPFIGLGGTLTVGTAGFVSSGDNMRVCSDHASLAGGTPCATAGFHELAVQEATGSEQLSLTSLLPAGMQTLVAELMPSERIGWISSLDAIQPNARERRVLVDLDAPALPGVVSPSDVNADGYLNAVEQLPGAPGVFRVRVEADEDGPVSVLVDGQVVASGTVTGGFTELDMALAQGERELYARMTDLVGNVTAVPAPAHRYRVSVDTVLPMLAYANPTPGTAWVAAGDSQDLDVAVTLEDHEIGTSVQAQLLDSDASVGFADIVGGRALFPGVMTEGTHRFVVRVVDLAGNVGERATDLAQIEVDTQAPQADITSPAPAEVLSTDADPALAGFQVAAGLTVGESGHAVSWTLDVAPCDETFAACGLAVEVASGSAAGLEARSAVFTPEINERDEYRRLTLTAMDEAGNSVSSSRDFAVEVTDCLVGFDGLPTGVWIGAAHCDSGGAPSCEVTFGGQLAGVCADLADVALYDGGGEVARLTPDDSGRAVFTLTATDGGALDLQLRAFIGSDEVAASAQRELDVDLTAPVVTMYPTTVLGFQTPGASPETWGIVDDADPVAANFQMHVVVEVEDVHEGAITLGNVTQDDHEAPGSPAILCSGNGCTYGLESAGGLTTLGLALTLPDQVFSDVALEVWDPAGNTATVVFAADIDIVAPAPVDLSVAAVDARSPAVTLAWTAPGEDGTAGTAVAYDIRYSRTPIDATSFASACAVATLVHGDAVPEPAEAGTPETFVVRGPDPRDPSDVCRFGASQSGVTYYFAARTQDRHGNWSAVSAGTTTSTSDLRPAFSRISFSDAFRDNVLGASESRRDAMTQVGLIVGDVDGDGHDDFVTGSSSANAFCLFRGGPGMPDDWVVDNASGARHACKIDGTGLFASPTIGRLAAHIDRLGDINGDGLADFAVSATQANPYAAVVIYLGVQDTGPNVAQPDIVIRDISGVPNSGYISFGGAGDFTGTGVDCVAFGEPMMERIVVVSDFDGVVPGVGTLELSVLAWTGPPRLTVQTTGFNFFGMFLSRAGNVLGPVGPGLADGTEVLTTKPIGDNQVFVIPGRPIDADVTVTISPLPPTPEQATEEDGRIVRLLQEGAGARAGFPSGMIGVRDLTGDGVADIFAAHAFRSPGYGGDGKVGYIFDGAALASQQGKAVRIQADADPIGDAYYGVNGMVLVADVIGSFRSLWPVGNWDGWSYQSSPTSEVAMGTPTGVQLRMNHADGDTVDLGLFPWIDLELTNPYAGGGVIGFWSDGGSDVNGDGLPDVLTGTSTGEIVIVR